MKIIRWDNKEVIFESIDVSSIKELIEEAIKKGINCDCILLDDASLDDASFNGATLDGASLYCASLDDASLYCATFNGASFNGATLDGASFDHASLDGASFNGIKGMIKIMGVSLGNKYWKRFNSDLKNRDY